MKNYLLNWDSVGSDINKIYYRCRLDSNIAAIEVWKESNFWYHLFSHSPFYSFEEVINAADQALLERRFILLNEEQSKKYLILK